MKKSLIFLMILGVAMTAGCSAEPPLTPADGTRADMILTGEPAIDAASLFYTREELKALNLYRGSDAMIGAASAVTFSVMVNGPLSDRRLVRGKKAAVNVLIYGTAPAGEIYYVYYGFSAVACTNRQELKATGYGNMVAIFDIPNSMSAARLYYKIKGDKGSAYDNGGSPFTQEVFAYAVSLRMQDGRLTLNYSGRAAVAGCYMHAGWNNWNNIYDIGMNVVDYSIPKYAQPGGYATVSLDVPWWADYMDFVFKAGSVCDNNGGADWHYSVKPLVDASFTGLYNNRKNINVYYANGGLNPPIAHYGHDGWAETGEKELSYNYGGQWSGSLDLNAAASKLDICFHDRGNNWNNNFGKNWQFTIQ